MGAVKKANGGGADSSISGLLPGLPGHDIDPGFSIKSPFDSSYDPGFSMWNTDEIMEAIKKYGKSLKDAEPTAKGQLTPLKGSGGGGQEYVYASINGRKIGNATEVEGNKGGIYGNLRDIQEAIGGNIEVYRDSDGKLVVIYRFWSEKNVNYKIVVKFNSNGECTSQQLIEADYNGKEKDVSQSNKYFKDCIFFTVKEGNNLKVQAKISTIVYLAYTKNQEDRYSVGYGPSQPPQEMGNGGETYVTKEQLQKLFVNTTVTDEMITDLNDTLIAYDITTTDRIAYFLGQCTKESGQGKWTGELYDGDPVVYFTNKYENRKDLGNNQPGDGYRFRGVGYIQVTGRDNYQAFANTFKDKVIKEKIMTEGADYVKKHYAWRASGFWWHDNGMNAIVDRGTTVKEITSKVNYNLKYQKDYDQQIKDRTKYTNQAFEILGR